MPSIGLAPLTFDSVVGNEPRANVTRRAGFTVRRILLPFDLSRASVCALRAVTQVAETIGASIHLLHVVKPADRKNALNIDTVAEESERMLRHWIQRVVEGRVQTFVSVRIGDPVDVIVARAVATRAELIVMSSRSCSALKNELQRSTAERISRLAPCPVLTIPEKCADQLAYSLEAFVAGEWRTVLLPIDFSSAAQVALRLAAEVSQNKGAKLLLAHGCESNDPAENELRLRRWAEANLSEPVPLETTVWPGGHSLYAILSEALRAEANLIIMPTRVGSWARRLRAGSITDGVLRQAHCPVLSINENISLTEV
ncbi:MAG TPA: universal stress protein [Candidatus Kapabacteria bacterium]|nr:universal stress protein [Candidatus Kapabacteria bacterium]